MITDCTFCKRGQHSQCDGGAWILHEATDCDCYMNGHQPMPHGRECGFCGGGGQYIDGPNPNRFGDENWVDCPECHGRGTL